MSVEITYTGKPVRIGSDETLLEGLERAGFSIFSSCRAGVCQCCMLKAVEGSVPAKSQNGLKQSLRDSGHFLACVCRPDQPIVCEPALTADFRGTVEISGIFPIGPGVVRVRFLRPEGFNFLPGQFVTLRLDDGLSRSYSIASSNTNYEYFDIHVRKIADGKMSSWFHCEAQPSDCLWMEGPKGECVYYPGTPEEPMTLVGTGTGIAPLYAIAEDALRQGHTGPINIYQGAVSEQHLYFVDELKKLARIRPKIRYIRCVLQKSENEEVVSADLKQIVTAELHTPAIHRVYLCGDPGLVGMLKKQFFLAGVSLQRLHADPFVIVGGGG